MLAILQGPAAISIPPLCKNARVHQADHRGAPSVMQGKVLPMSDQTTEVLGHLHPKILKNRETQLQKQDSHSKEE